MVGAQISSGSTVSAPVELAVVFGARLTLIQSLFLSLSAWRSVPQLGHDASVAVAHFRGSCTRSMLVVLGGFSSANEERRYFVVCPFSCFPLQGVSC